MGFAVAAGCQWALKRGEEETDVVTRKDVPKVDIVVVEGGRFGKVN